MIEAEIKVRLSEKENLEARLSERGFCRTDSSFQQDIYFDNAAGEMRRFDRALRIRTEQRDEGRPVCTLNCKGPRLDMETASREELELEISSAATGRDLLCALGFSPAGSVEKRRTNYVRGDVTCSLDTVTGLGCFLEAEILAKDHREYEEASGRLTSLLQELGIGREAVVTESYLSLLYKKQQTAEE